MHDTMSDVVTDEPATDPSVAPVPPAPRSAPAAGRAARPDPWRLHVLGPVELSYDGRPVQVTGIARSLLALLARDPGEEVSTAGIIASIWGSDVPDDAENTIASNVSRLRKALTAVAPDVNPTGVVVTMPTGYILNIGAANVDSETFERYLADGQRALIVGQPELAQQRLDMALGLWRGTAYEDFGDQSFTRREAERLAELKVAATESRVDTELALAAPGVPPGLLERLQDLVAEHWHRERLWGQLMTVLYRLGKRGDALAVFRQAELRLARDMSAEPGAPLRAIERAVLNNSPSLYGTPLPRFGLPEPLAAAEPACVGRDEEVAWLLAGLDMAATRRGQARLVVGSPGIGKSRLLSEVAQAAARRGVVIGHAKGDLGVAEALRITPDRLNLIVIDDLDLAPQDDVTRVVDFVRAHRDDPVLTLLSCRDQVRVGELGTLPKVVLTALGDAAVAEIVRVYAPNTATAAAVSAMANAGGVPARVHRAASEWAFARAGRRIDRAAASAAEPRRALDRARDDVIAGVLELEHVRVQARPLRTPVRESRGCPYRGLAAYGPQDAPVFHGRRQAVAELVARLVDQPLLALVGPRGSGKSSVLRAGLAPALAEGILPDSASWRQFVVTPSSAGTLRARLAAPPPPAETLTGPDESAPVADFATAEVGAADGPAEDELEARPFFGLPMFPEPLGFAAGVTQELPVVAPAAPPAVDQNAVDGRPAAPVPHSVVIVDQFEEVYTLLDDDARWELLDALVEAASSGQATVVLGLRSEFYPSIAAHPDLADLVTANTMLLAAMTDDELWEAVVEPAAMVGISVELALAETLVAVAPEAGLASLSLTLQRLWRGRDGQLLTLASYHSGPGMPSIIAATGEASLAALGDDGARRAAGTLLANLAARTSDELLVARSVPVPELLSLAGKGGAEALNALVDRELVTVTDGVAEIAHEELMVGWPRLRDWLDEASAERHLREHLRRAATVWSDADVPAADLYGGARLAAALDYHDAHPGELSSVEADFLKAGQRVVLADEIRRRRRVTRLWRWLVAITLVLAATIAAGVLVFIAWQDATAANTRADAVRVGAAAVAEPDLQRALLLAVAGVRLDPTATAPLRQALLRSPDLLARFGQNVTAVAASPDGDTVAAGTADGVVWLLRAGSLESPVRLAYPSHAPVNGLAFSPDGRRLVSWAGSAAHPAAASVVVWDVVGQRADGAAFGQSWPEAGGGLLADGSTLILTQHGPAGSAPVAWSLDARTPSTAYVLPADVEPPLIVAADGTAIGFATAGGSAVVSLATGHRSDLGARHPAALSPDGARLLALSGHDVEIWDVGGHRRVGVLHLNAEAAAAAWAPGGKAFAVAESAGGLTVYGPDGGLTHTLAARGSTVVALQFGRDGDTLYAAGAGGVAAWDLTGARGIGARIGDGGDLADIACGLAGRELTAQEWAEFLPAQPYRHVCA